MTRNKFRFIGLIQLILVVLIISGAITTSSWLASLRKEASQVIDPSERTIVVTATQIEPVNYRISFDTTGVVQARSPVSLVPQVSGKIIDVSENLFPGGVFEKGEVLFQIEKDDFKHEIQRLEAELARAQTSLELQKAESRAAVQEWKSLHETKPAPPLVARIPQLNEAKASVKSARALLETAKLNLKRTSFSLPFSGRVTATNLELGQFVTAGQSLGSAYSLKGVEILMPVDDRQFGWLMESHNPDITVQTSYLGKPIEFKANIKRRGAEYDPQTRFTNVILDPRDEGKDILPGMFVDIKVIGPTREKVWLLPVSALQEDNKIWIITKENRLQSFDPQIINITQDYVAAYSSGSSVKIVTGPIPEATEGSKVRIRQDNKTD